MNKYQQYLNLDYSLPSQMLSWNLYGAGLENIGVEGKPEVVPVPEPGEDQLLVRVDCVGLCFSDIKIIQQGSKHPKLYGRDLKAHPTRLGHEASITIVKVGEHLKDRFRPGQRYAVQPDIYQNGISTAYGYTIPGGLVEYHLIGREILETDEGACLLPVDHGISMAASALLEPWGCVVAAYTQRRRLQPKPGGLMWIIGQPNDTRPYTFQWGLDLPSTLVLTNVPDHIAAMAYQHNQNVVVRNDLLPEAYADFSNEFTAGKGFDDIIILNPRSAQQVAAAAQVLARRGVLNLVGDQPLDAEVPVDVGRLHYDYIALIGNSGLEVTASYGEENNRCDLIPNGVALFVGAGGPMGQMHVQRAIESPEGPRCLIVTDINAERLQSVQERFSHLAEKKGRTLILVNTQASEKPLADLVMEVTQGQGVDDAVICAPVAGLVAETARLLAPHGMLVMFAGLPIGTYVPMDVSRVYLHKAQYTGTSGLTLNDQGLVLQRARAGELSPAMMVAAVGGMYTVQEGYRALMEGRYPGKIMIYPHLKDLPLLSLSELAREYPDIGSKLGPGNSWTLEAEAALFERFWNPE